MWSRSGHAGRRLLAVALGVLPLYAITAVMHLRRNHPISMGGFAVYLGIIAPASIAVVFVLLRAFFGERLRDLNLKPGKVSSDLLATLVLVPVILAANVVSTSLLAELFPESAGNTSVRLLFTELAGDPKFLVLFAGPLVFLGAASEELIRAFLLSRLWKLWRSVSGKLAAVAVSAVLFGLMHIYQGPVHVIWASLYGVILALYYLRFGRVAPLVLAHYVTTALQILVFAARTG